MAEHEASQFDDEPGEGIDLDEWLDSHRKRRRHRADGGDRPAELSPLTLLYTGFFVGPPATLLVSLMLLGRRLTVRSAAVIVGVCGASWCAIQGASVALLPHVDQVHIQVVRTLANFTLGLGLLIALRMLTDAAFGHDRSTWMNTAILAAILLAIYVLAPDDIIFWLGR